MTCSRHSAAKAAIVGLLLGGLLAPLAAAADRSEVLRRADDAFARRAEGAEGVWAQAEPIATALAGYREALTADPSDLAVRSRVLHAIFFQAEYHFRSPEERKRAFDEGCRVFQEGLDLLSKEVDVNLYKTRSEDLPKLLADRPEAGPFFFWGALHWGLWGQYFGKMAGLRQGVAKKIRILGEAAIALAPEFENGGGHRLVGRLHALAPRVPLVTGWVRRDLAVELLEEAYRVAPDDPLNRLFLGQVLLDHRPKRRDEAERLIRSAAALSPRQGKELEDIKAVAQAKEAAAALE